MTHPNLTPPTAADLVALRITIEESIAHLQQDSENRVIFKHGEEAFFQAILDQFALWTTQLETAHEDHQRIRGDYERELAKLSEQLTLEQTASNRTIAHLVTRKDALEEQYKILSEQSRITLEVAANTEDALIERVQALEGALAILQRSYDELFNSRERWSDEKIEELKLFLRVARAETKESEKERDALAAAMPSEGADAALAYAAMKAERDRLQNRLRDYEEDRKDTTLYRAEADPTP